MIFQQWWYAIRPQLQIEHDEFLMLTQAEKKIRSNWFSCEFNFVEIYLQLHWYQADDCDRRISSPTLGFPYANKHIPIQSYKINSNFNKSVLIELMSVWLSRFSCTTKQQQCCLDRRMWYTISSFPSKFTRSLNAVVYVQPEALIVSACHTPESIAPPIKTFNLHRLSHRFLIWNRRGGQWINSIWLFSELLADRSFTFCSWCIDRWMYICRSIGAASKMASDNANTNQGGCPPFQCNSLRFLLIH